MYEFLKSIWPHLAAGFTLLLAFLCAGHALIYKRDSRASVGWVGLIVLVPVLGSILYLLLGINRIRRKVAGARDEEGRHVGDVRSQICTPEQLANHLPPPYAHLAEMARLTERLTGLALLRGNNIQLLTNGDEAYPAMLAAIENACASVTLTSYIFDNDRLGQQFVAALSAAVQRGVEVRVLIDAVGARYSLPPVTHRLRLKGVRTARFMPSMLPWATPYFNLRNHRKILVVDGTHGFTGGMNIRAGNILAKPSEHPIQDIHFHVTGPVIQHLQATFVTDWLFTTGEVLTGEPWFMPIRETGPVVARAIPDGPDRDYDKMRQTFLGALAVARSSVRIQTPYFLPDAALISAINTCALRGVQVDIVIPEKNNLKMVQWAAMAQLWQLLEWGCRIWQAPPPFDHGKLMVVDDAWTLIGSANWDPRSLRLNFEFGLECYHPELAAQCRAHIESRIKQSVALEPSTVRNRRLPVQLRDGFARLFAPYL